MIYGTCQGPWGKSVQEKLQVLTIATSRVDMSQHWTTFNFFVRYKNQIFFFFFFYMAQEAQNIVLYLEDTEQLQCYVILSSDFSKKLSERKKHTIRKTLSMQPPSRRNLYSVYTSRHIILHFKPELQISSASLLGFPFDKHVWHLLFIWAQGREPHCFLFLCPSAPDIPGNVPDKSHRNKSCVRSFYSRTRVVLSELQ